MLRQRVLGALALLILSTGVGWAQRTSPPGQILFSPPPGSTCYGQLPNGLYAPCQMDANGNIYVMDGAGSGGGTVTQGTAGSAAQAWYDQIVYGGSLVSNSNKFPVTSALDALISGGALSVNFSNTSLAVTNPALNIAQGAAIGTNTGSMPYGLVLTANPTYSNQTLEPITENVSGFLKVSLSATSAIQYPSASPNPTSGGGNYAPLIIAAYNSTPLSVANAQSAQLAEDTNASLFTALTPAATPSANNGLPWVSATAASILTGKGSAGNLYNASVTMSTVAGFLVTYNSATAPSGSLTASLVADCVAAPASVTTSLTYNTTPEYFSTGLQVFVSTSCTSYTAPGTLPVFIKANYK